MRQRKTAVTSTHQCTDDPAYGQFLERMRIHFASCIEDSRNAQLFTTDASKRNVFDNLFLANLPADQRQHHNCSACRKFVEKFGSLVIISPSGKLIPVIWPPDAPEMYQDAYRAIWNAISHARVTGVFLDEASVWGTPSNADKHGHTWEHFAVTPPPAYVYRGAGQKMAAIRENYATVQRALAEVKPEVLDQALRVFEGGHVDRAEHFIGPVRWLRELHDRPKGRPGENLLWRAVASAPEGYCHPRASVVWPLLESIIDGKSFEFIKRQFDDMVSPLRYQRPTEAPSAGTIKQAEEAFAALGLQTALERRFARMEDIQSFVWRPSAPAHPEEQHGGVFSHIKPKDAAPKVQPLNLPPVSMSWRKFKEEVLPNAERIEVQAPQGLAPFHAFTAAVHADAGRLLKWDREDHRNTVAWYTYAQGSSSPHWGMIYGSWYTVKAVIPFPTLWGDNPQPYLGEGDLIAIEGCLDSEHHGNAIFPETLRADLHGVRSVIEAYSKTAELGGRDENAVCGLAVRGGAFQAVSLRVWKGYQIQEYRVYRLD